MRKGAQNFNCAVVTMSDKGAIGQRDDTSGKALQEILLDEGYTLKAYTIIPDVISNITETITDLVDTQQIDLIITTGGTGVSPSDVTPEAMREILDKEIPGMAEAMRAASFLKTPHAVISRAMAGIRRQSLIINLPGSERAARENIEIILPSIPHALEKIKGGKSDCGG